MTTRIFLLLVLVATVPGWSQATGGGNAGTGEEPDNPVANDGMLTPPPVSGQAFPVLTGAETRKNYLNLGVVSSIGYDDNVEAGYSPVAQADMIYSIAPTISLDRSSARFHQVVNYSPGFSFYEPNSIFNASDQDLTVNLQYLIASHTSILLQDNFIRSSSLFNQPFSANQGAITGIVPTQTTGAIAAFANRVSNAAMVQLTNQASENGMFGLSADYGQLDYPQANQVVGLYNSTSYDGSAFATQRLTRRQYLGGQIQHARIVSYLKSTDNSVLRDNIFGFYTVYLRNSQQSTLSLSVTGGPEHYSISQTPYALVSAWLPAGTISLGWQAHISSGSASYTHAVTAGGGLPGAYTEDAAQAMYRRQLSPLTAINFSALYSRNVNLTPTFQFAEPGGHTIGVSTSVDHMITRNLKVTLGYDWMDQTYTGVGALSQLPTSNHEYCSVSYQITRPVGR
ncbi:MAG: hypothetical protein ACLGXA_19300 [Acidobacteriota bacterium]